MTGIDEPPLRTPRTDRIRYDYRYAALRRTTRTFVGVRRMGYLAGLWGKSDRRCPVRKPGDLYYAWQEGHRAGAIERERIRPRPPTGEGRRGRR